MNLNKNLCALILLLVAGMHGGGRFSVPTHSLHAFPRVTLWAWERREDLRQIDVHTYGVAYLDQTIVLTPEITSEPRQQPLLLAPNTKLTAVVRISGNLLPATPEKEVASRLTELILSSATKSGVSALQIDFDATRSERDLYRTLLTHLRSSLPQGMPLSITALASWCSDDRWLADLPIDEAVPMFFRMGESHPSAPGWTYPLREPKCMNSAGVSMDEAWPRISGGGRIYVFHPRPWNPIALHNLELLTKP